MPAYRDKRTKQWRYRKMLIAHGQRHRISGTPLINTRVAAEAAERAKIEEILAGPPEPQKEVPQVPTLKEFSEDFMATYAKTNNKESEQIAKQSILNNRLLPHLGERRLDEITLLDVEKLKAKLLAKPLEPKSVNNALGVLRKMLRHAKALEIIKSVPTLEPLKTPPSAFRFLEFEEWEQLVAAAADDEEVLVAVLLGGDAGLRVGEIVGLRWMDVDTKRAQVTVRVRDYRGKLGTPKGGKGRTIPLTGRLNAALKKARHLRGEHVICNEDGKRLSWRAIERKLAKVSKRAKIPEVEWHVLRHTFCSHLAMRGAPARAIQELAGHASITTTQRYMHLSPGASRSAIDLLEGIANVVPTGTTRFDNSAD